MAVILPKAGKTYRYEFTVAGVTYKGSTGIKYPDEAAARQYEADLKAEKQAEARKVQKTVEAKRTLGIVDANGRTVIPTILMAVDAYWAAHKDTIAEDNRDADEKSLFWLVDEIGPETLVTEIRNATVEKVVQARAVMPKLSKPRRCKRTREILPGVPQVFDFETGNPRDFIEGKDDPRHIIRCKASSVNRTSIDILKRVILYARNTLEVPGMPAIRWKDYRLKEPPPRTRTLSHAEEAKIEEHLREGFGAAFKFAVTAGFRLMNYAGSFIWDQVDFEKRRITIIQKGGDVHTVVMTDDLEAILREQLGRDPRHVFVFRYKGRGENPKPWTNPRNGQTYVPGELYPVTYWGFGTWFDDIREATGLTDLTIHDLRRTAASRVIRETGNLEAARHLTGHKSNAMLLRVYNHLSQEEARADLNEANRRIAERRAREVPQSIIPQSTPRNFEG